MPCPTGGQICGGRAGGAAEPRHTTLGAFFCGRCAARCGGRSGVPLGGRCLIWHHIRDSGPRWAHWRLWQRLLRGMPSSCSYSAATSSVSESLPVLANVSTAAAAVGHERHEPAPHSDVAHGTSRQAARWSDCAALVGLLELVCYMSHKFACVPAAGGRADVGGRAQWYMPRGLPRALCAVPSCGWPPVRRQGPLLEQPGSVHLLSGVRPCLPCERTCSASKALPLKCSVLEHAHSWLSCYPCLSICKCNPGAVGLGVSSETRTCSSMPSIVSSTVVSNPDRKFRCLPTTPL